MDVRDRHGSERAGGLGGHEGRVGVFSLFKDTVKNKEMLFRSWPFGFPVCRLLEIVY